MPLSTPDASSLRTLTADADARRAALARRYLHASRQLERTLVRLRATFHGATLGLATDRFLEAVDESYYNATREYVDRAYNEQGLWDWERDLLDRYFSGRHRVVVTGAGGGREVLALADLGLEPVGYECNAALREFANRLLEERGHQARVHPAPRDGWPPGIEGADGVLVGWGSYMLLRGSGRRTAFLRDARARVDVGTPILLSFFARSDTGLYFRTVAQVGSAVARRRHVPIVEIGDALSPNYVHYFTQEEIEQELRDAGWRPVSYEADDYGRAVGIAT